MSKAAEAVWATRRAFVRAGLDAPTAIILSNRDDGMALLSSVSNDLPADTAAPRPVEHPDGSVWMEVTIIGIAVRWPASKKAVQSGGFIWT